MWNNNVKYNRIYICRRICYSFTQKTGLVHAICILEYDIICSIISAVSNYLDYIYYLRCTESTFQFLSLWL